MMTSSVHFRFKSAREFETLSFEGDFLKVADLKVAIVERKKLNFGEGFDLEISDESTKDVFHDESALVPKNTSVIVRRIPGLKPGGILSHQDMAGKNERYAEKNAPRSPPPPDHSDVLKTIEGADEADRIASLISQASNTAEHFPPPQPRGRFGRGQFRGGRGRGAGRGGRGGRGGFQQPFGQNAVNMYPDRAPRPSQNYVCHRCNQPGHWIDQCPTNGDPTFDKIKVRAPTGIPRSMLRQVDAPESGTGLQDSSGQFVTLQPNEEEFARQTVGLRLSQAAAAAQEKDGDASGAEKTGSEGGGGDIPSITGPQPSSSLTGPGLQPSIVSDASVQVVNKDDGGKSDTGSGYGSEDPRLGTKRSSGDSSTRADGRAPRRMGCNDRDGTTNPRANGTQYMNGRGAGRHVNRNTSHVRQGRDRPPAGLPLPGIPLPHGAPPGFPGMGLPPFPPGMPPPPPHMLMAMMAAAQGGGVQHTPFPPVGMPTDMPIPFPPQAGVNGTDKGENGSSDDAAPRVQQSTGDSLRRSPSQLRSPGKVEISGSPAEECAHANDKAKDGELKDEKETTSRRRNGMNPRSESVVKETENPLPEQVNGHVVDCPDAEKVESSPQSKPEMRNSRGKADDRRERDDVRMRDSYENDRETSRGLRHHQEPRLSRRPLSRSQRRSPRELSFSPRRRSPSRERRLDSMRRRERFPRDEISRHPPVPGRGRMYEERGYRDTRYRPGDPLSPRPQSNGFGRERGRDLSPPRERAYRSRQRRYTPSPPRGRRDPMSRSSRNLPVREISPEGKSRYGVHRSGRARSSPRVRRDRKRSLSPRRRTDGREPRRTSRDLEPPRRDRSRRGRGEPRSRRYSPDQDELPSARDDHAAGDDGEPGPRSIDEKDGRDRPRDHKRGDSKRIRLSRPDDADSAEAVGQTQINHVKSSGDAKPQTEEKTAERSGMDDSEPRKLEVRSHSPKRTRSQDKDLPTNAEEVDNAEAPRSSKRLRRDRSVERDEGRSRGHRDRRSVHDRLGQLHRERRRSRKSVHDRLG